MEIKYIDVHTHVNLNAFSDDWRAAVERSHEAGVAMITVGTQIDTSLRAIEVASQFEKGLYATIGIHPVHTTKSYHDAKELGEEGKAFTSRGEVFDKMQYLELARHEKVVAIGECGLDYYRVDKDTKAVQEKVFIEQIELANEVGKPLMLHIRASDKTMDAYEDAIAILKVHAKVRGNVHFFAGTYEVAKKFWDIGFTSSFTGVITFTNQYNEVVEKAPLDMIHAETDAPYVAPVPHRGTRNEPLYVQEVYRRIADLKRMDAEVVRRQLLQNAEKLFTVSL